VSRDLKALWRISDFEESLPGHACSCWSECFSYKVIVSFCYCVIPLHRICIWEGFVQTF